MQFTKLFNSILDSTIWQEPLETKVVWITMLAMCDRNGDVHASIPGLARRAGVTITQCNAALACLESPDEYSRTKDHDGRRIAEIDGGWSLLNHGKYRALLSAEERREYNRRKQAEYRAARKSGVNDMSMTVNDNEQCPHITEAEAEAENKQQTNIGGCDEMLERKNPKRYATHAEVAAYAKGQPMPISEDCIDAFFDRMEEIGWTDDKGLPLANWQARFRRYATNWTNNRNRQSK
jgi:hypothetical protein